MRIAISTDGEQVSAHFGRCPAFTILDIDDGRVVGKEVIENPGHQPGFIPQFLHDKGVNCIIAGGMGPRAAEIFQRSGHGCDRWCRREGIGCRPAFAARQIEGRFKPLSTGGRKRLRPGQGNMRPLTP